MRRLYLCFFLGAASVEASPAVDGQPLADRPVWFEPNQGQADPRVRFFARGRGYHLFLNSAEATVAVAGEKPAALTMRLIGARGDAPMEGSGENGDRSSYFLGDDWTRWVKRVPHFNAVRVRGAWPGVDVRYYENGRRRLEHDFIVAPGADPARIQLRFEGGGEARIDDRGALVVPTAAGGLRWEKPEAYQIVDGARRDVEARYRIGDDGVVDFELGEFDGAAELVIDPELVYARFAGGSNHDLIARMVYRPSAGELIIAGRTNSADLRLIHPYPAIAQDVNYYQLFLLRRTEGGPTFLTYFGGVGSSTPAGIAVDSAGASYVTGYTAAVDFPQVGALVTTERRSGSAFAFKLSADGATLYYSILLGGREIDEAVAIAVDSAGAAYVAGVTSSSDFPVTPGVLQPLFDASTNGFAVKINPGGTALAYSTFVPGRAAGLAVNSSGEAYVAGYTSTPGLATAGAYQLAVDGTSDAYLMRINAAGTAKLAFTYYGGSGSEQGGRLALAGGAVILAGETTSANLPLVSPIQSTLKDMDAYVAVFGTNLNTLTFATYLGGDGQDTVLDLAAAGPGAIVLGGGTNSTDFPIVDPVQQRPPNPVSWQGWLALIQNNVLTFSTTIGGRHLAGGISEVTALAIDPADIAHHIYLGGNGYVDFPADRRNAAEAAGFPAATIDAFYARLSTTTGVCLPEMWLEPSGDGTSHLFPGQPTAWAFLKIKSPSNCNWTIDRGAASSWLFADVTAGTGVEVVRVQADPNNTGVARTATILLNPGAKAVTVDQMPTSCTYQFSPASISDSGVGSAVSLTLTPSAPSCVWRLQGLPVPDWIVLTQTSGTAGQGAASFSVVVKANESAIERIAHLDFGAGKVIVSQGFCSRGRINSNMPATVPAAGGVYTFQMADTGCPFLLTSDVPWVTFSPASGIGGEMVTMTVAPNATSSARTGTAFATWRSPFQFRQAGRDCTFSLTPANYTFTSQGGTAVLAVGTEPGCQWGTGFFPTPFITGTGPQTIRVPIPFNPTTSPRTFAIEVGDSFAPTAQTVLAQNGLPAAVPVVLEVDNLNQTGDGTLLHLRFADANGANDLNVMNVLINDGLDGRNACYLAYVASTDTIYLVGDAGGGLLQPGLTPGNFNTASNSQCTVQVTNSFAEKTGNLLYLANLQITFKPAFAGTKTVYAAAGDLAGNNSGWQPMGVWTVPGGSSNSLGVGAMTPARGGFRGEKFTLRFNDTGGFAHILSTSVLINHGLDGRNACYFGYHRPSNTLLLLNDPGTAYSQSIVLGGTGAAENSQCRIDAAGSSSSGTGNDLTLELPITFKAGFGGGRIFHLSTQDGAGTSGWKTVGTYLVQP